VFTAKRPVKAMDPASAIEALNQAFTQSAAELVQWTAQKML